MLCQCLIPSITKKVICSGTTNTYSASNAKFPLKYFNISESQKKLFLIQNYFYRNAEKYKPGQI